VIEKANMKDGWAVGAAHVMRVYECSGHGDSSKVVGKDAKEVAWVSISVIDLTF
jgi:hypothetical protein